ncbi:MAG: HD domain-containing protein [Lachnospiraceae bacterium]|nr:HD domain-containing protein [Lachnospiraceae bacterium]
MKYIETLKEGERISDIYLCKHKQALVTKNGKPYETVILQDKTGTLDAKIWEPNSAGIDDFDVMDYVEVMADITSFQGALQANVKRVRKASEGEYDPQDFLPTSEKNVEDMYKEFVSYIDKVKNPYLNKLLKSFYVEDAELIKKFKFHSAAKSVHHGFVGGLLEHSLSVTKLCDYYAQTYTVLNRDLLLTAAMLHDVGKTWELSAFPVNDYTDDGQLLGHIMIGAEEISYRIRGMEGFPAKLASELKHCILAHHGELEYGSPKKPALAEAVALNLADNTDAKMQTIKEMFHSAGDNNGWLGYNRLFESNFRKSTNYND